MTEVAILVTCFNRKQKTLNFCKSVFSQKDVSDKNFTVFLVDDGSTDGTREAVEEEFPAVNVIKGNGNLFWVGGMRLAWDTAFRSDKKFDYFLLMNDDVSLFDDAFKKLFNDHHQLHNPLSIMVGSFMDPYTNEHSYGGWLLENRYNVKAKRVVPNNANPQPCNLLEANMMLIPAQVVEKIGFFSDRFVHRIADNEYGLRAMKAGIPSYIASSYAGYCHYDRPKNWKSFGESTLRERIQYLYSVKGIEYKGYIHYIKTYFPLYLPQAWAFLWGKTFFPVIWDKLKKSDR